MKYQRKYCYKERFLEQVIYKKIVTEVDVAVNFLFQLIFIFPLFQIHLHSLPYPKTIEK